MAGFASLAQGGLGKWGCEKLKLGSFKNNFVLPPFKKVSPKGQECWLGGWLAVVVGGELVGEPDGLPTIITVLAIITLLTFTSCDHWPDVMGSASLVPHNPAVIPI